MITTKANGFLYLKTEWPNQGPRDFLMMGGGRLKIPVWLFWSTAGVLGAIFLAMDIVFGVLDGSLNHGPNFWRFGLMAGLLLAPFAVYWPTYGLVKIVQAWIKVFRRAL